MTPDSQAARLRGPAIPSIAAPLGGHSQRPHDLDVTVAAAWMAAEAIRYINDDGAPVSDTIDAATDGRSPCPGGEARG